MSGLHQRAVTAPERSGVSAERRKLAAGLFRWRLSAESRYARRGKNQRNGHPENL
jgi:hypothetical protein